MMDVILSDETGGEVERFSFRHEHDQIAGILGLYESLWFCPDNELSSAGQLVAPLEDALRRMEAVGRLVRAISGHEAFMSRVSGLLAHCRTRPYDRVRSAL